MNSSRNNMKKPSSGQARTAGLASSPRLNVIVITLAGGPNPRVEILALL